MKWEKVLFRRAHGRGISAAARFPSTNKLDGANDRASPSFSIAGPGEIREDSGSVFAKSDRHDDIVTDAEKDVNRRFAMARLGEGKGTGS